MMSNTSTRDPNSVTQTGVNQLALVAPLASIFGYYLGNNLGMPLEVVTPAVAVFMGVVTMAGTFLRNLATAKGWMKYIG